MRRCVPHPAFNGHVGLPAHEQEHSAGRELECAGRGDDEARSAAAFLSRCSACARRRARRVSAQAPRGGEPERSSAAALIGDVLSPRNRMEEDLRVPDRRDRRPRHGQRRLRGRAPVGHRGLPARGCGLRQARVLSTRRPDGRPSPRRRRSSRPCGSPCASSRSGSLPPRRAADRAARGRRRGRARRTSSGSAPKAKGAIALVRTKPMLSFDDLFAEYLAGPEMLRRRGRAAPRRSSSSPRGRGTCSTGTRSP